jgi:acyl carrier protein
VVEIKDAIRTFILTHYLQGEAPANLRDDQRLVSSGILDSLATMELVGFVQRQFRIELTAAETLPAALDRIDDIARLVAQKRVA